MGTRSKYITQSGRSALERLTSAYKEQTARHTANLSPEMLAVWERQQLAVADHWAAELDKADDKGIEYEMMLDFVLIAKLSVAAQREKNKNAKT
jgi:hypothetical protein